jgi:hypothetical protein
MPDQDTSYWQDLLQRSGIPGMGGTASFAPPGLGPSTQEAAGVPAVPPAAQQMAMAGQGPQQTPVTAGPIGNPQTKADQQDLRTQQTQGSGIERFQGRHPLLGGLLRGLDIAGSVMAPRIAQEIPGSTLNYQRGVDSARQNVTGDIEDEQKQAQTRNANAEATKAERPPVVTPKFQPVQTAQGIGSFNEGTGEAAPLMMNGQPAQPVEKQPAQNVHVLPDGKVVAIHADPQTGKPTAEVVYQGDPKVQTHVLQREVGGKPRNILINSETGKDIADLGETGEKPVRPPVVNVNAGTAALDRESTRFAKGWEKAGTDANAQLEKIADARAMINGNAESQALGVPKVLTALVSGQGSGVRITQAELNMIAHARGIQGDFNGFINRVSGKGQLTPEQQAQLTGILDDVKARISQKSQIANEALDAINGGGTREEIIQADKLARQKISDMEKSGGGNRPTITTQAQFDKLPSGAEYLNNGKPHRKP